MSALGLHFNALAILLDQCSPKLNRFTCFNLVWLISLNLLSCLAQIINRLHFQICLHRLQMKYEQALAYRVRRNVSHRLILFGDRFLTNYVSECTIRSRYLKCLIKHNYIEESGKGSTNPLNLSVAYHVNDFYRTIRGQCNQSLARNQSCYIIRIEGRILIPFFATFLSYWPWIPFITDTDL